MAHVGYKVCIVDTDRNQNSLAWVGERNDDLPNLLAVGITDSKALNKMVDQLDKDHDFIIIDGTPSLSEMSTRIILASDLLLIPILPSGHDIRSMQLFFERYEQAKEFRDNIPAYFFLNQFSDKVKLHQSTVDLLKDFGIGMLKTKFRRRIAYAETSITGQGVYEYSDPKAKEEVVDLTKEVLSIAKKLKFL